VSEEADLLAYYRARAPDYAAIYEDPLWAQDLAALAAWLRLQVAARAVLELACGTGHWTAIAAGAAARVVATDLAPEMLALARARAPGATFRLADAWDLPADLPGPCDAALAALWWSHVPRARQGAFLAGLAARLAPGARLLLIDQQAIDGAGGPRVRDADPEDRWQRRHLPDGRAFDIRKNHPDPDALRQALSPHCKDIDILSLRYFWATSATFRPAEAP
jgi:demethylmenaquinone methyltransferase/2-methoxy-6-polyprenyl-1,4-benzoquinol methylase